MFAKNCRVTDKDVVGLQLNFLKSALTLITLHSFLFLQKVEFKRIRTELLPKS